MGATAPGMVPNVLVIPRRNPAYLQERAKRIQANPHAWILIRNQQLIDRIHSKANQFIVLYLCNSWRCCLGLLGNCSGSDSEKWLTLRVRTAFRNAPTHRGAMSIWLMKTPQLEMPPREVESVRKATVRTWLQPTKPTATRKPATGNIPAQRGWRRSARGEQTSLTFHNRSVTQFQHAALSARHHCPPLWAQI